MIISQQSAFMSKSVCLFALLLLGAFTSVAQEVQETDIAPAADASTYLGQDLDTGGSLLSGLATIPTIATIVFLIPAMISLGRLIRQQMKQRRRPGSQQR